MIQLMGHVLSQCNKLVELGATIVRIYVRMVRGKSWLYSRRVKGKMTGQMKNTSRMKQPMDVYCMAQVNSGSNTQTFHTFRFNVFPDPKQTNIFHDF